MVAPLALSAFNVAPVVGRQALLLTWTYNAGGDPATQLDVQLQRQVGGVTWTTVATPWKIANTVEPHSYEITTPAHVDPYRVIATPENGPTGAFGPASTSSAFTILGSQTALAASVTPDSTLGGVAIVGQGFLNGLSDSYAGGSHIVNESWFAPLSVRQWRMPVDVPGIQYARTHGISTTMILSDQWWDTKISGSDTITPWSDWAAYEAFVAAQVHATLDGNYRPDYFDVWNEPGVEFGQGWPAGDLPTKARWLELFRRAWAVIKGIDSTLKVVAPSLAFPNWTPHAGPDPTIPSIDDLLADAATNTIVWDAVAWHENETRNDGDPWDLPENVDRHIANVKLVLAAHPGTVVGNRLHINEYANSSVQRNPGWNVGMWRAFEDGVSQANRAIWSDADRAHLNGLLTTSDEPTGLYWAHRRYTDLILLGRMRITTATPYQVSGLAGRYNAQKTVRVLLGRHQTTTATAPAATFTLTVEYPFADIDTVNVTMQRLSPGGAAVTTPASTPGTNYPVTGGTVTISVGSWLDGEALYFNIVPVPTTPAAPVPAPAPSSAARLTVIDARATITDPGWDILGNPTTPPTDGGGTEGDGDPPVTPPAVEFVFDENAARETLRTSHLVSIRAQVLLDGKVVAGTNMDPPILFTDAGSITVDRRSKHRRRFSATVIDRDGRWVPTPNTPELDPLYRPTVRLWRGIVIERVDGRSSMWEWPIGWQVLEDNDVSESEDGVHMDLSGNDLSALVADNAWTQPYRITGNPTYPDAIKAIIDDRLPAWAPRVFAFEDNTATVDDVTFDPADGKDPWDHAQDLATAAGMELFFYPGGSWVLQAIPQLESASPIWVYDAQPGTTLLSSAKRTVHASELRNGVVVESNAPGLLYPVRGEAWDLDPESPTFRDGPFGRKPERITDAHVYTDTQANVAAAAKLRDVLGLSEDVTFDAIVLPFHEAGDVVVVQDAAVGLDTKAMLESFTIPFDVTSPMSPTIRRPRTR